MTNLEKINRPVTYLRCEDRNLICKGQVKEQGYNRTVYFYFKDPKTNSLESVWIFSLLDTSNISEIAKFKVKKLHDTR